MDPSFLLPQFGNFAFTIVAFIVALSIIVAIHEYGHYIVGRWSGIHAEVFSLGFGPVLFSRVDRHGTRWQVAALPFGGYVKFLGDANAASVGGRAVSGEDRRRTMLGAPLWARSATVAAGPVFNFILSFVVFAGVFMVEGRPVHPLTVTQFSALPAEMEVGLRPGDEILAVAGQALDEEAGILGLPEDLPREAVLSWQVRRDGVEMAVEAPHPFLPLVTAVNPDSAAWSVDIRRGDVVLAVNGAPVLLFEDLVNIVMTSDGQPLTLTIWRAGEVIDFVVVPRRADLPLAEGGFETRWLVGLVSGLYFDVATASPPPLTAAGDALRQVWFIITSSLSGLWHMLSGAISTCNLSGPVGIAQASGAMATQGGTSFIWFVAVLSTAVGLLNLFPVPILDGGHLVFHAWEAVTGKPPSESALRILMAVGLALILTLMLFAIGNDLFFCP